MFKITKKTILPLITFISLLVSCNKSNGMNPGWGMSIGPSGLLAIEKPISLGIIKPLQYISSKFISGAFCLGKYLLRRHRLNMVLSESKRKNCSPFTIAYERGYWDIIEELQK